MIVRERERLRAEWVNAFLESAASTMLQETAVEVTRGASQIHRPPYTLPAMTARVELHGDLTGEVLIGFPEPVAAKVASQLAGGDFGLDQELIASAVGELANIIAGRACGKLAGQGLNCDITPPQMLVNASFSEQDRADHYLATAFTSPMGEWEVLFWMDAN